MKLYHSVDATASEGLDDEKGVSEVDADILSSVDKCCEDTVRCDGAHNSRSSDQLLSSDEKENTK